MLNTLFLSIRAAFFYVGYVLITLWFFITTLLFVYYWPFIIRQHYLLQWNRSIYFWLRVCCGIKAKVIGLENVPSNTACVVLSKHQSPWETFYLQLLFAPLSTILKKELLRIPAFGWGIGLMKPIAIDRSNPRQSLKQLMEQGKERLEDGISVLVFPEGTRTNPGEVVKYARGGANLAKAANVPIILVAHNAGDCWPSHQFLKYPGTITVMISEPFYAEDKSSLNLTNQAKDWIEDKTVEIRKTN